MTKAQINKLNTLIGKLELLQAEVIDRSGDLARAKSALLDALRKAEGVR